MIIFESFGKLPHKRADAFRVDVGSPLYNGLFNVFLKKQLFKLQAMAADRLGCARADIRPVYGDTGTERSLRTRLALDQIEQRLAGTDGLGAPGFDLAAMTELMFSNRHYSAELVRDDLVALCREKGALFHSDAVQAAGYLELDMRTLGPDLLSFSGHKIYGPKGVGVLYVRSGTPFRPLLYGGAQERGRRGGTENVPAIVGMARALEIAVEEMSDRRDHALVLRRLLVDGIRSRFGSRVRFNSPEDERDAVPQIVNVSFPPDNGSAVDGEMLLLNLDLEGVRASAGSACTSGALEPSHVLLSMGIERQTAAASVRFSTGKDSTREHVEHAVEALGRVASRMGI